MPVIERELRVQARRPATYWMRLGWGLAAVGYLAIIALEGPKWSANGANFLTLLHGVLAVMLSILAPAMTADTISRERREGTLGLLFLTTLTPRQVVWSKFAAQFMRLFYVWLVMVPFMTLPMLLGGIGLDQFLLSLAILFAVLLTGISAGMLASAVLLQFTASLGWALVVSAICSTLFAAGAVNCLWLFDEPARGMQTIPWAARLFFFGWGLILAPLEVARFIQMAFTFRAATQIAAVAMNLFAGLFFLLVVRYCSRKVRQHAESAVETKRQAAFRQRFLTPMLWKTAFRNLMRRRLDNNPFIWLEYRGAWSRGARWAVLLLLIGIETLLVIDAPYSRGYLIAQFPILCGIVLMMTLKSSSSFQREKESGAFELILVTPITERRLVAGRLRAVSSYYRPVVTALLFFGILALSWRQALYPGYGSYDLGAALWITSLSASLFSVPAAGLYFAIRFRTFFPALLWTAGLAVLGPPFAWTAISGTIWYAANRLHNNTAAWLESLYRDAWVPVLCAVVLYHAFLLLHFRRATRMLLSSRSFVHSSSA